MKYEKPIARNLSEISFAEGICTSGRRVGTCYDTYGLSAGYCSSGDVAGFPCEVGGAAANNCTYGYAGYYNADCVSGGIARGG